MSIPGEVLGILLIEAGGGHEPVVALRRGEGQVVRVSCLVAGWGHGGLGPATRLREESVDVNLELRPEVDVPVGDRRRAELDPTASRVARPGLVAGVQRRR